VDPQIKVLRIKNKKKTPSKTEMPEPPLPTIRRNSKHAVVLKELLKCRLVMIFELKKKRANFGSLRTEDSKHNCSF